MNKVGRILGCVVLGALFMLLFTIATMWLWNWLVPSLFGGPTVTFWQTAGLLILSKILFSGFGGKHCHNRGQHGSTWNKKFYEKFSDMTPEERNAFKQKMRDKWCSKGPKTPPSPSDNQ